MYEKATMLDMIAYRIDELCKLYRATFDESAFKTAGSATNRRSVYKKDLGTCRLLKSIVAELPDDFELEGTEEIGAFERLTEPRRLK